MPPENVRYPSTQRAKNYIKNRLPKCYNAPPKPSHIIENKTKKTGFRRFYLTKDTGLFRGWWKNNMRHGFGTQINKVTQEIYEGGFRNDKRTGYGVLSYIKPNGTQELRYEGDFANDVPNGTGDLHTDSYHFIGRVINGKASGVGVAWYKDGSVYFGSWFSGKRMGLGMLILKNKNRYEGNWYDDKKHGYGQYCFFDRGQAQEGIWVANVCVRGIMRNIKYRQAAVDPIKYTIPKLMLKDWTSAYYVWEKEAFARVGKYVKEDIGIETNQKDKELETKSHKRNSSVIQDSDISHKMKNFHLRRHIKFPPRITEVQPCVIFR
ncbi:MORN repeat-containing protein 3 [Halyomorpha halys]|uniref:MORN repeat-containing protein 3 n=1 Tax=Halyomorpha halys TaxID=286706 RepID=UPI0006D51AF2|nr:MORN repeat-containing protein 3-like [Halyomorpha halys]